MGTLKLKKRNWLEAQDPRQPVTKMARRALRQRLWVVRSYLPLAAKRSSESREYVHQLRISTRRAAAALEIFEGLLPATRARKLRSQLKRIRRAAGTARDLDVLKHHLSCLVANRREARLSPLIEEIAARRRKAQKPLVQVWKKLTRRDFKLETKTLLKRVRWRRKEAEPCFADVARTSLEKATDEFFSASQVDREDLAALHDLRIAGKQLRYAMELLGSAFDKTFRTELYPVFEQVQEKLGRMNDHVTARRLYLCWSDRGNRRLAPLLLDLAAEEETEIARAAEAFNDWWKDERVFALRQWFETFLEDSPSGARLAQWREVWNFDGEQTPDPDPAPPPVTSTA